MNEARQADDLARLRVLWQGGAPEDLAAEVDVSRLRRTLQRRRGHTRVMMALDVAATVATLWLAGWMLANLPGVKWALVTAFLVLLAVGTMVSAMLIRRRVWSVGADGSVSAMVSDSIRQLQATLAIVRLTYWVVAICFVFLALWAAFDLAAGAPSPPPEVVRKRWFGYGFSVLYGGAFVVGAALVARGRKRELARWESVAEALREDRADAVD